MADQILNALFGLDGQAMPAAAAAAIAEAEDRASDLEKRCETLLALLNGELSRKGCVAVVHADGRLTVGPAVA